jgi:homoserine O-acetyltransferase/O-succinyltransferase
MDRGRVFADWLGGLAIATAALLAAAPAHADSQFFTANDVQLEDGTVMAEMRIAYETQGTLSPARDNAIVLLHGTLGDKHAFDSLIGPAKLFDTSRYFVITADAFGGGESSSPADGAGQDFPRYTIRDMMAAEYALVSSGLGIAKPRALVGRAMGSFIALEWAVQHPDAVGSLVLLAPTPRTDANYRTVIDLLTSAVAIDSDWNGGHYERNPVEGLRHAGMVYYPWSVSAAYLDQIPAAQLAQESEVAAKSFAAWDANSLVLRYAACREHDVGTAFGGDIDTALARVNLPVLLMPSASDRLMSGEGVRLLRAALPHAIYAEIPGDRGQGAIAPPPGTPEADFIDRTIRAFLK